ncbi:hypothetical protein [Enterococcus sp. 5H]|uniref:hypothetical protein n=1 Tax=Enterococcus sp. 5H TaxID=1229490 RepID=UPI002303F3DA|nr:hypothetical protein [Enterococcus sp. 5H]MDA9472900.1 hypothetical protein [Enterococcus sp. 5H]
MTEDVDTLTMMHSRVIENLKNSILTPAEQVERLRGFQVTDEIASDFSDITVKYAKELSDSGWITPEQYEQFLEIDRDLEEMNKNKSLWNDEALKSAKEWEQFRKATSELLKSLGY